MKIVVTALSLIVITVSAQSSAQDTALPADVMDLILRRTSCDDWTARGKADPALAGDLPNILAALRCNEVQQREATLRELYQGDSIVLSALNARWTKVVRRLPIQVEQSPQP